MNTNKKKIIRIDFIFSYWIFFWFVIYQMKLVSYNPKNAIIFSIWINVIMLLYLIHNKSSKYYLFCTRRNEAHWRCCEQKQK